MTTTNIDKIVDAQSTGTHFNDWVLPISSSENGAAGPGLVEVPEGAACEEAHASPSAQTELATIPRMPPIRLHGNLVTRTSSPGPGLLLCRNT